MARSNFTANQRQDALDINALFTAQKWGSELRGSGPHCECEHCHFVSNVPSHFQVDHIHPCARGGTRNRWTAVQFARARAGDIELIYQLGINHMVLCFGCNQAKKARQFIPPGAGYAWQLRAMDMNPDHIINGPPPVTDREIAEHPELYDPSRYR